MGRAPCCDKATVKKGPWSPEEDSKLKDYIEQHGTGGNWIALPKKVGLKRCGKSCRLRWLNYLRPNIKHGEFSEEEDRIICTLYINIGSRWSIIAAQLPGRTDNDIKNYWNTKLKKKLFGKRKDQHNRRLAAASSRPIEVSDLKRYVPKEFNTSRNVYGPQSTVVVVDQHMDMNMKSPCPNLGSQIIPNFFEQTISADMPTNADVSPSTQSPISHLNLQHGFVEQISVPDRIPCFTKLMESFEATLNINMMGISHMEHSNFNFSSNNYTSSQIPFSAMEIADQDSYQAGTSPQVDYKTSTEIYVKPESPRVLGALLSENDNSVMFPPTSSISCGSYANGSFQTAWISAFIGENSSNMNMEASELSIDWNDLLNLRAE
ncbi:hypothetical protein SUGI_0898950 [Cryptomeria japonica]|uniref:transcription factor MYB7 n=1 Tax=Cryptomeria japonica TaxID=3369 RepID=UPI002414900C|nr:transcription factor MYB7 [Cryptomeria japonica]GLJ43290.1 hypothetical protein SUGI_0898950 [Cryptomeria japonica]